MLQYIQDIQTIMYIRYYEIMYCTSFYTYSWSDFHQSLTINSRWQQIRSWCSMYFILQPGKHNYRSRNIFIFDNFEREKRDQISETWKWQSVMACKGHVTMTLTFEPVSILLYLSFNEDASRLKIELTHCNKALTDISLWPWPFQPKSIGVFPIFYLHLWKMESLV